MPKSILCKTEQKTLTSSLFYNETIETDDEAKKNWWETDWGLQTKWDEKYTTNIKFPGGQSHKRSFVVNKTESSFKILDGELLQLRLYNCIVTTYIEVTHH